MAHPLWALFMGFEHERIHLETSSVLIRELPVDLVRRPAAWPAVHASAEADAHFPPRAGQDYPVPRQVAVPAGRVSLGKIWGTATLIVMGIGPALGSFMGGYLADTSGNFTASIQFAMGAFALSAIVAFLLPLQAMAKEPAMDLSKPVSGDD